MQNSLILLAELFIQNLNLMYPFNQSIKFLEIFWIDNEVKKACTVKRKLLKVIKTWKRKTR